MESIGAAMDGLIAFIIACGTRGTLVDYYSIFALNAGRDVTDYEIHRQYIKLAVILHPDRNHCAHAELAFKYVKLAYDKIVESRTMPLVPVYVAATAPTRPAFFFGRR